MQNYLDIDAKTGGAFDPDVVRILIDAFDGAWQSLEKSGVTYATDGHATETRDRLAKRIIELARGGERNQRACGPRCGQCLVYPLSGRAVGNVDYRGSGNITF